jgi:hypothetical protein
LRDQGERELGSKTPDRKKPTEKLRSNPKKVLIHEGCVAVLKRRKFLEGGEGDRSRSQTETQG